MLEYVGGADYSFAYLEFAVFMGFEREKYREYC